MKAIATVGERLQLIKDWQLSGLTISEWCRRNGIHKNPDKEGYIPVARNDDPGDHRESDLQGHTEIRR